MNEYCRNRRRSVKNRLILLTIFTLFIVDLNAHQDRIYSFESEGVNVEIHTGFLFYLENDKAKILAEMIAELRVNLKVNEKIKVNYVHNYIGVVEPQVVISDSIVKVSDEYTEDLFRDGNNYGVTVVVVANQLPIKEILCKLYSVYNSNQKWSYKDYQFNTKYGEYGCKAISKLEKVDEEILDSFFCGKSYSPTVNIGVGDKYYFEFCDFSFRIIRSIRKYKEVVLETDSIYQLSWEGLDGNAFIFESQMTLRYINGGRKSERQNHPKICLYDAVDHFRQFKVISIGRKMFILKYRVWGDDQYDYSDGSQVYYDADNRVYQRNFEGFLYNLLCE